jgi:hypothetical protein
MFLFRNRVLSRSFTVMVSESIRNCSQSILHGIEKSPVQPQMLYDMGVSFTDFILGSQA